MTTENIVHHRRYNPDDIENRSHASVEQSISISVSRVSSNQTATVSDAFDLIADRYRFWFLLIAVFLAFWPYYAGYHDTTLEQSILRSSLNYGTMFYESAIVSLTLLVPLVFDVVLEVAHQQYEQRKTRGGSMQSVLSSQDTSVTSKSLLETREKILIYTGFASTPLLIFVHKDYPNLAMLWFCTTRFQLLAVYGSVWVSFCRLDNLAWPPWTVFLGLTLWTIGLHLTMYNTMFGVQGPLLYVAAILKYSAIYGFFTIPALRFLFLGFFKSLLRLSVLPLMYTLTTTVSFLVAIIVMTAIGSYDNLSNVGLLLYNGAMILLELGFLMFYIRKEKVKSVFDALVAEIQREREGLLQRTDAAAHLIINDGNAEDQVCLEDDDDYDDDENNIGHNGQGDGKDIVTGDPVHEKPTITNQGISDHHHHATFTRGNTEPNAQKTLQHFPPQNGDMAALQHAYRQAKTAANVDRNVHPWGIGRPFRGGSGSPFGALHRLDRNNYECESSLTSRSAGAAPLVYRFQMMNPFGNGANHRKQKEPLPIVVDIANGITTTTTTIPPHSSLSPPLVAINTNNTMIYGNDKIDEVDENEEEDSTLTEVLKTISHHTNHTNEGRLVFTPATNIDSVSSPAMSQTLSNGGSQSLSGHLSSSSTIKDQMVEGGDSNRSPSWYRNVACTDPVQDNHGIIRVVVTSQSESQLQLQPPQSQLPLQLQPQLPLPLPALPQSQPLQLLQPQPQLLSPSLTQLLQHCEHIDSQPTNPQVTHPSADSVSLL